MRRLSRRRSPIPTPGGPTFRGTPATPLRGEGTHGEMYNEFHAAQDRTLRQQDLADRMAERRKQALADEGRPRLRARVARRLFALAVAADRRETWNEVWDRLEARGRL